MLSVNMDTGPTPLPAADGHMRYIARQPIFDIHKAVFGYELLFRSGVEDYFQCDDPEMASCTTMDRTLLLGTDWLTRGKFAFVNCTRDLLVRELVTLLPRDRTVLEILETVEPDRELVLACEKLKRAGYILALDDYAGDERWEPLLHIADIIKVDFKLSDLAQRYASARRFKSRGISLLAEKVETNEEFEWARENGYRYFQGYFFCRPTTVSSSDVAAAEINCLQILEAVHQPSLDLRKIEEIIKHDPSLCYRLLRYLNSAAFGVFPIRSVRHALLLLGESELRKWISVVVAATLASRKPPELLINALTRAQFCEAIAKRFHLDESELFLIGLLSLIDAMLDHSMEKVLPKLPLSKACKDALLGYESRYRDVLEISIAFETGDWARISELSKLLELEEAEAWPMHAAALVWASDARMVD